MFKKIMTLVALLGLIGLAQAGFDQYTSKNYTTLMAPRVITTSAAVFSNALDGVDISGLIGNGALVINYVATNMATSVISFSFSTSTASNGTYVTYTNSDGRADWTYTNAAGVVVLKFRPNTVSRFLRTTVAPTAVTNGACSVLLVTE